MFKILRRLNDRRRYRNSRYGWLFQPYTGDELVAVSARQHLGQQALEVAVWRLSGSELEVDQAPQHLYLPWLVGTSSDDQLGVLDACLEQLLDALGNRPLLGWRLERIRQLLNAKLRDRLGFDLPNAGIDVAQLYQRRQRMSEAATFNEALAKMAVVVEGGVAGIDDLAGVDGVVGEARATVELYRKLQSQPNGWLD